MSGSAASKKRAKTDIRPDKLDSLSWSPDQTRESLNRVYQHVVDDATDCINWYLVAKRSKRRWARRLRVVAIFMVAVAGVLPVLSQILDAGSSGIVIQPAWATVALAIAAALIVLDRFFGFSSAWARYMVTGQAITEALNQFRLNWQLAASKSSANELTQDSFDELLGLAKALTMEKDRLVKVETLQWVKEFGESLAEMDRSASEEGKK